MSGALIAPIARPARIVGRYALFEEIASGGMATIHIGRLVGEAGFSRTVAVKRLHPHFSKDPEFRAMFVDEARVASRIRHPNVVATLDVVNDGDDLLLVMEYVSGESLARLLKTATSRRQRVPAKVAAAIGVQVLHGLHAAHEATDDAGQGLGIVHRDVSPQNVLVGGDGVARVIDFGVAKAVGRMQTTREGVLKGKLPYMPPEQLGGKEMDRRCDVYAASVVLWEMLTGTRLFASGDDGATYGRIMRGASVAPSQAAQGVTADLDAIVMRGLAVEPDARFQTAREMAKAIEGATATATAIEVGEWVESIASALLSQREESIRRVVSGSVSQVEAIGEARATEVATGGTMSLHEERKGAPGRALVAVAALGVCAAAGIGGAWWTWAHGTAAAPVVTGVAASESATEVGSASASASAAESAAASGPASAEEAAATGVASASAATPHRGRRAAPVAPVTAPRCRPPYYFDPDGTKHYKPECI